MNKLLPILLAAAISPAPAFAGAKTAELQAGTPALELQEKTSMDYLRDGSAYYIRGAYKRAIGPYQKALDLEKKERKLGRKLWIVLVDNLGMAYGITGDIKSSHAVFEYGISQEPEYPLFYYNMACGFGELGDEDNAIKYLRPAFKHRANMLEGERFPDPMTDSSFAKFRDIGNFRKVIMRLKRNNTKQYLTNVEKPTVNQIRAIK